MTYDFFMGQLRIIAIALIAYAAGKGWLSAADASTITAILTPIGLIAGPWVWSLYRNANMKLVPKNSVAVAGDQAQLSPSGMHAVITGARTDIGDTVARVVGVLLFAFVLSAFLAGGAQAQVKRPQITGNIVEDTKANLGVGQPAASSGVKLTGDPVVDLQTAITKGGQKLIMNLKQSYALAMAKNAAGASADNTSATCTKALVPIVDLVVNGPKAGTVAADDPMALTTDEQAMASDAAQPEGIIVKIEKARILRLSLQSPALNDACGALVQDEVKNAQGLVGKITSLVTGAGMAGIGL